MTYTCVGDRDTIDCTRKPQVRFSMAWYGILYGSIRCMGKEAE